MEFKATDLEPLLIEGQPENYWASGNEDLSQKEARILLVNAVSSQSIGHGADCMGWGCWALTQLPSTPRPAPMPPLCEVSAGWLCLWRSTCSESWLVLFTNDSFFALSSSVQLQPSFLYFFSFFSFPLSFLKSMYSKLWAFSFLALLFPFFFFLFFFFSFFFSYFRKITNFCVAEILTFFLDQGYVFRQLKTPVTCLRLGGESHRGKFESVGCKKSKK